MEYVAAHITVKGQVQGVGFRWFTQRKARLIGVKGYVRNVYNGDVEIFVEGEKEHILELIDEVSAGPSMAFVSSVTVDWQPYEEKYTTFSVNF